MRHLQKPETVRGLSCVRLETSNIQSTIHQVLRLLASAMHVPAKVYNMHSLPWPQMQKPALHESHRNAELPRITSHGRRCTELCWPTMPICALHCATNRWDEVRQGTQKQRPGQGQSQARGLQVWRLPDVVARPTQFAGRRGTLSARRNTVREARPAPHVR